MLLKQEMFGDWYRDPWGWPELTNVDFIASLDPETDLGVNLKDSRTLGINPHFHTFTVPKSFLGVRPAVVQDPVSRLLYSAAVGASATKLQSNLPDWVFGWRVRNEEITTNRTEWPAYVDTLPREDADGFGLLIDLTSFFSSIDPVRLMSLVYRKLGKNASAQVIERIVTAHHLLATRSGLPQRSFASAILANIFLQPLDDALSSAQSNDQEITTVRRWMDDISAEGSEGALFQLMLTIQDRARQVGLELNISKTHLDEVARTTDSLRVEALREVSVELKRVRASAYTDVVETVPDLENLLRFEDEILSFPASAPRPTIKAVLHSLQKHEQYDRIQEWAASAKRMPQVADTLGRYFRAAPHFENPFEADQEPLSLWFTKYLKSTWGRQTWVTAQLALAFRADRLPSSVRQALREWLETSDDIHQIAIATQRLCESDATTARSIIRSRVDKVTDPLLLRIFALGLLQAGDDRSVVEAILHRDARNRLLHTFLNNTSWKSPAVVDDFSGNNVGDQEN